MAAEKPLQQTFDTQRIPLYDIRSQTKSYTTGTSSYMAEQLYWNCYPVLEKNLLNNDGEVSVQKRPGILGGLANFETGGAALTAGHKYGMVAHLALQSLSNVNACAIWDATSSSYHIIAYSGASSVKMGTIAGGAGAFSSSDYLFLSELTIGGNCTLGVVFVNATTGASMGYYATSSAGFFAAASLISMAAVTNFPPNLGTPDQIRGPMVQMNGTTYVMGVSGYIYNSDLNSITSWNSLGKIGAIQAPDLGVGLARYKNFILAFGSSSLEFFTDVGTAAPASPLQKTDQAFSRTGAIHAKSIISINDDIFWMSRSTEGSMGMFKLGGGYTPTKVLADKGVEQLETQTEQMVVWLQNYHDGVRNHIITNIPCAPALLCNATYSGDPYGLSAFHDFSGTIGPFYGWMCVDITTGSMWVWQTYVSFCQSLLPVTSGVFIESKNTTSYMNIGWCPGDPFRNISSFPVDVGHTVGEMYNMVLDSGIWVDSFNFQGGSQSNVYACGIQFDTWDFGTEKRKRIHKFKVVQQGLGQSATLPYTWVVYLKEPNYLSSNFATGAVITARPMTPATQNNRLYLNNLGAARYWSFGIVNKSDGPWRAQWLEVDISQGTN